MTTGRINQVTTFLDTPIVADGEVHFLGQGFIKWSVNYVPRQLGPVIPRASHAPTSFESTVGVGTHRTGNRICLISPISHVLGIQSPRRCMTHDANHGPLRELASTGNRLNVVGQPDLGGFSKRLFGERQAWQEASKPTSF
jgi:hypothetical protein